MLAREEVANSFGPGSHASTFGGNPVSCAAGLAVMHALVKGGVLKNCVQMGKYFVKGLEALKKRFPCIRQIRGKGLIIGVELDREGAKIADGCRKGCCSTARRPRCCASCHRSPSPKKKSIAVWRSWKKFWPGK
jgi:acetylornithine/succinyldiaminopimelate/putrescine aminotransferase